MTQVYRTVEGRLKIRKPCVRHLVDGAKPEHNPPDRGKARHCVISPLERLHEKDLHHYLLHYSLLTSSRAAFSRFIWIMF